MALTFFHLNQIPSMSAKEVLSHVTHVEAEELRQTPAPVVYQKLQLRRRSSSDRLDVITWEIWRDPGSKRFRHRVEDSQGRRILQVNTRKQVDRVTGSNIPSELIGGSGARKLNEAVPAAFSELGEVFSRYRANFEHPLSPDNFAAWAEAIPNRSEEALQAKLANGDEAFVLRVSGQGLVPQDGIMNAELTVRKRDWQPVEQRLQVKTADGTTSYILDKLAFKVVALNIAPSWIFAQPSMPVASARVAPVPLAIPVGQELATEDDLTATEVEVWYGLHSVGACLGRPMTVVRTGHKRLDVEGTVESEERKTQILAALRGIPHVTSNIRTVAESLAADLGDAGRLEANATVESRASLGPETSGQKMAAKDLLVQFFAEGDCAAAPTGQMDNCIRQKSAEISREALISSEAALSETFALRQLAEWYSSAQQTRLRVSGRRLVELMVRDHLAALRREWNRSRTLVTPALNSFLEDLSLASEADKGNVQSSARSADWVAVSQRLCSTIERTTNLMVGMFVETNLPVGDPKRAAAELLATMTSVDETLVNLEAEVASGFSDTSKVVTKSRPESE
jgi:hypothetical protein